MTGTIIAIHGKMGSGKSTTAEILRTLFEKTGSTVYIVPLAGALKDFAKQLGWNGEKDEKGRRLLQLLGTEVGRQCISDNIWIDKWKEQVKDKIDDNTIIICDDVRFPNELTKLREFANEYDANFLSIKIIRDNLPVSNHTSEQSLDNKLFDAIINNNYSMEALVKILETIVGWN